MQAQCWICPECYDDSHHQPGDKYCRVKQRNAELEQVVSDMQHATRKVLEWLAIDVSNMHPKASKDGIAAHIKTVAKGYKPQPQPAVPERWKLVPVEPTKRMREAFHKKHEEFERGREIIGSPDDEWKAMLRAAPETPEVK